MLKSKIVVGLFVTVLILILVAENEVDAAPQPCGEFFKMPKHKPKDKDKENDSKEKEKEEEKKRQEKKKKEKLKAIEKFFEDLIESK